MRIIAFIQDAHSIRHIMKVQGIADFRTSPPIKSLSLLAYSGHGSCHTIGYT
jgi:hypothetical protein